MSGFWLKLCLAQPINISDLRQNDSFGVPYLLNQTVTISGEVTVTDQFGITASIEDTTGGVAIYDANFVSKVNIGDVVTVSGTVTQFCGLTELKSVNILEQVSQSPSIEPQVITCYDIATEGANGIEKFEGELVRINDVTVNTNLWNVTGSGVNYTLTDNTGSCEIRIDKDTNISNTSAPIGSFDVIGVVAQYDQSSPFTQDYQLMPRFRKDIIGISNTTITHGPEEKNITPYSMDISWITENPSNSVIMYGRTTSYEIDTIFVDESVDLHNIQLTGLSPATVYHLKVGSGQGQETIFSNDHIVITASHPSSTGEMRVYFNQSVDHTYARYKQAAKVYLLYKFIQRVNSAKYSIDACFYNITCGEVAQVFIGAFRRGVKVRIIYDYDPERPSDSDVIRLIKNENIPIINDKFGNNSGNYAMHNKFMVIDHRDTSSASDDWVWTGSYNLTYSATDDHAENVIEIQDQALAECYTIEFNEMWGSDTNTPDPSKSRFGSRKTNNTPHVFSINDIEVLQYMSPSDNGLQYLIREISQSQSSLFFCMLIFTNHEIADAMKQKWLTVENFKVKAVFETDNAIGSQYENLYGTGSYPWNPPADVHLDKETNLLHHKYLIIDGDGGPGQPMLITGSYNWSYSAESSNDENFLIIKDSTIANLYLQEFAERYHKAGGTENLTFTSVKSKQDNFLPTTTQLSQNYPNPFNQQTTIKIALDRKSEISLEIFNVFGQQIKLFDLGIKPPGNYEIIWDGYNNAGEAVAGGIYFYRLNSKNNSHHYQTKKMIYLP